MQWVGPKRGTRRNDRVTATRDNPQPGSSRGLRFLEQVPERGIRLPRKEDVIELIDEGAHGGAVRQPRGSQASISGHQKVIIVNAHETGSACDLSPRSENQARPARSWAMAASYTVCGYRNSDEGNIIGEG